MRSILKFLVAVLLSLILFMPATIIAARLSWQDLPEHLPTLPSAVTSGYAAINGAKIWYATFGKGKPVILIHGGLGNSNNWGYQVPALAKQYQVIVMDSRGHGRSTNDQNVYSYSTMANDVIGLMDHLNIKQAAIVGWSDGAIIGLDMAIHHPERVSKLFAFAANSNPNGTIDGSNIPLFKKAFGYAKLDYQKLSPTPKNFEVFLNQIKIMWATQPNFSKSQLNHIKVPTWIVDGDHDQIIKREDTEFMAAQIPKAGLLILPNVNHFALIQDPEMFNACLLRFLRW